MDRESSFYQIHVGRGVRRLLLREGRGDEGAERTSKGQGAEMRMGKGLGMHRGKELTTRICLGILKTDQWKPNSKMNQGMSISSSPSSILVTGARAKGEG